MIRNCEDCDDLLPCLPYKGHRGGKTWWLCDNCTSFPRELPSSQPSARNVICVCLAALLIWALVFYVSH